MARHSMWCFFAAVAPAVLFVGLVEREAPVGARAGSEPGPLADEPSDEAAHIQKAVRSKRGGGGTAAPAEGPGVRFFRNEDVLAELPRAPAWAHKNLQGVLWLDQRGVYGSSNLEERVFNDLAITFGGADVGFDLGRRTVTTYTSGLSWTWFNDPVAYRTVSACQRSGCGYNFTWNLDYTACSVVPFVRDPSGGAVPLPTEMLSYTMTLLEHAPGECPPKPDATRAQRSRCAFARRDTQWMVPYPPFFESVTYYVFKIGDAKHEPVQPYFDAYLAFANSTSRPSRPAFKYRFGSHLPASGERSDVQMVSTVPLA